MPKKVIAWPKFTYGDFFIPGESKTPYCALRFFYADDPCKPQFLCVEGRLVVFDDLAHAQETLEVLGSGLRYGVWDSDRETLFFVPTSRGTAFNRIEIWKNYDPYDVPSGFRSLGIWSEGKSRAWKYHSMWHEVYKVVMAWADEMNLAEFGQPISVDE